MKKNSFQIIFDSINRPADGYVRLLLFAREEKIKIFRSKKDMISALRGGDFLGPLDENDKLKINSEINRLKKRDQCIIKAAFGIGVERMSLKEMKRKFNINALYLRRLAAALLSWRAHAIPLFWRERNYRLLRMQELLIEHSHEKNRYKEIVADLLGNIRNSLGKLSERQRRKLLRTMPVEIMDLSIRSLGNLRRTSIETIAHLCAESERTLWQKSFGSKSAFEIKEGLERLGLKLKQDKPIRNTIS